MSVCESELEPKTSGKKLAIKSNGRGGGVPKRMFNGDKAWRSDKLKQLREPLAAEYAWMYPIALADGTFEADPHKVWSDAYSYNRKGFSPKKIAKILDDFEKCGLLLRTKGADGKTSHAISEVQQ